MIDLNEAIAVIPEAIDSLYAYSRDHIFYNSLMGILSFDELELFHTQYFECHLEKQLGLNSSDQLYHILTSTYTLIADFPIFSFFLDLTRALVFR